MNPFSIVEDAFPIVTHIGQSGKFVEVLKDAHEVWAAGGPLFDANTRADPKRLAAAISAMQKNGQLAHLEAAAMDLLQSLGPILANPQDVASLLAVVKDVTGKAV